MKSTLLIGIALLTCACGSNASRTDTSTTPAATSSSTPGGAAGTIAAESNEKVTLIGCLQGPAQPRATGTAGSAAGERARARPAGDAAETPQAHGSAANGRYVLMNAAVEAGGVGANGAGASGGPLVSAGSEIELDGVPADAQASVNKQVRVTGRIDSRPAGTARATADVGRGAAIGADAGAAAGTPTGGASTRDDVRANSTTIAGDTTNRRVAVETVQVVGQTCAAK